MGKNKQILPEKELLKYKMLFVMCVDPWVEEHKISVISKFSFFA